MKQFSHEEWNNVRFRSVARWLRDDAKPLIKNTVVVWNQGKNLKQAYEYFKNSLDTFQGINNSSLINVIDYAIRDYGLDFVASELFNALFKPRKAKAKK